jgi:hypothetical protein
MFSFTSSFVVVATSGTTGCVLAGLNRGFSSQLLSSFGFIKIFRLFRFLLENSLLRLFSIATMPAITHRPPQSILQHGTGLCQDSPKPSHAVCMFSSWYISAPQAVPESRVYIHSHKLHTTE